MLTYHGDQSRGVGDLKCERVRQGVIRSFWKPTEEEIEKIVNGGVVELIICGEPIPPVSVNALSMAESNEPIPENWFE